jgi:hypothetical protein
LRCEKERCARLGPCLRRGTSKNARGPVSRVLYPPSVTAGGDHSSSPGLASGVKRPTRATKRNASYAAPIRSCTRWGLPCRPCRQDRGALLPHPFDLTGPKAAGMLSVALSLGGEPPAGRYPAPLFRGARTFLAPSLKLRRAAARPPGGGNIGTIPRFVTPALSRGLPSYSSQGEKANPGSSPGRRLTAAAEAEAPAASPGTRRRRFRRCDRRGSGAGRRSLLSAGQ